VLARPSAALIILAGAALAVAGCGGSSKKGSTATTGASASATTTTPTTTGGTSRNPPVVGAMVPVVYPTAGVRFSAPEGWRAQPGEPPLVATVQSGQVTIAVWRYPRDGEQMPVTHAALQSAKLALVGAIKRRDPSFSLTQAKLLHVGPERAVQVLGLGNVSGSRRNIRSTHIYAQGSEYVFDEYAPPTLFPRVDSQVFVPLIASVKISPPRK
jgi:hypothetical protein